MVIGLFFGIKAQVFEHRNARFRRAFNRLINFVANRIIDKANILPQKFRQTLGNRLKAKSFILAYWSTQVTNNNQLATTTLQIFKRRQISPNAQIITNRAIAGERHIIIGSHQHSLMVERYVTNC